MVQTMPYDSPLPGTLKRKRRRREDKPAISARLYLDSNFTGEVGVLSDDLVQDLYPSPSSTRDEHVPVYAALTPWTPNPSPSDSPWTILPFRKALKDERQLPPSTIRFPATALGTQSIVNVVQALSPNRTIRQNTAVEVRISDAIPLPLETVYVAVDTQALRKLEAAQKKYGDGFMNANGHAGRKPGKRAPTGPTSPISPLEEDDIFSSPDKQRQLVHDALSSVTVLHTSDVVPIPLTHPVTHASAPPAKVLACEPVLQGVLTASSKIVVVPTAEKRTAPFGGRQVLSSRLPEEYEEDEDTTNESFYSANEENSPAKPIVISKSATDMSNTDDLFDSSAEESNLSDDSDDMISLAKPGLADQPSGLSSALTSATPRAFGNRTGVSTPGSVYSNMTTSTVRGGQSNRSKVFRTQGLMEKIPESLLHPKPSSDEDDEARVFVDATALARLGCFSGDWVRIEPSENQLLARLSAFGGFDASDPQPWRPAKVYGLPESMSKRPQRYQVNPKHGRRDSISSLVTNSSAAATVYVPPVLLANLNQADNVSLSPLSLSKRMSLKRPATPRPGSVSSRLPPTASEVTLRKVTTPISTERALNNALFANLKEHFEQKQRIVKVGDLIAIPIDEVLGRSIYEGDVEKESSANSDLLSKWNTSAYDNASSNAGTRGVAWFSIEDVLAPPDDNDLIDGINMWGGAASIDPTKMTMRQSGDDKRKLPPATKSTWPYYLGVETHQTRSAPSAGAASGIPEPPQRYVSNLQRRLRELISVSTSARAVHLGMPPLAILLTSTQRGIGKAFTVQQTCADLGLHYFPIDANDILSESGSGFDTQAQGLFEARCERALECGAEFTVICLRHLDSLTSDRVASSLSGVLEKSRVLIATTTDVDKVPDTVRGLFTHELEVSAPDEGEREGILRNAVNGIGIPLSQDVDLSAIAVKTAALVAGDLVDVVDRATVARTARLEALAAKLSEASNEKITIKDIMLSGGASANAIVSHDFDAAVDFARKNFADSIGAPKIPNVQWSDVGGLTHVKDAVVETIQLPLSRPELFAKGLKKRSGILFYGPPGTGKTLLAKAIATEFSLNFFSVKGPELLNMYIGESEANVRRVFQRARDARPCVVFFDELDSVAPKRGNQGDSGGVMDRIVSQLLAELDGMSDGEESGGGVFVIGATNRPDLLDPALLRPGRFDKMLYLGISDTHDKQTTIMQALTRKFTLDQSVSLARVAETLPFTYTGADLYALCSDAMLKAITRSAQLVDKRLATINQERQAKALVDITVGNYFDHYATDVDTQVSVKEEDFVQAKEEMAPSVSVEELRHYERVRDAFEGATKRPASDVDNIKVNGSEQVSGGVSRPKLSDLMNRTKSSSRNETVVNGSKRSQRSHSHSQSTGGVSDADEDYVIRTDRLALNHASSHPVSSKGKGKAKAIEPVGSEGGVNAGAEEDLYD